MTLKEFSDKIINNKKFWNYEIIDGRFTLDNDITDGSHLFINKEEILITDFYIDQFTRI